ncbi:hypothetical protein [Stenotrophomonas acidaminiphila]|uniref:hypothetical protein n=1 Tax=Stenotrophomonas acidaminiphila TaxID=128780 RepID=UPI0020C5D9EA|nr:hypothetical protein [Stenotrophomonas acidaminiphila]
MSEAILELLLDCAYGTRAPPAPLSQADVALTKHEFAQAAQLYADESETSDIRAKRGFCLAMLGEDDEAETLLTVDNVGEHPLARAILAWTLAGRHGQRLRGFGTKKQMEGRAQRRATVETLLQSALSADHPPALVFKAAFEVWGTHNEQAGTLAARARTLYPQWGWAHAIYATRQRVDGTLDPSVLESLMRTLSGAQHADVYEEAYTYALMLDRFDDAERAIDAVQTLVSADPQEGDSNVTALTEMRAMVSLHRGRGGESEAYENIPQQLAPFTAAVEHAADGRDPLSTPKFLLQTALETGQQSNLVDAAQALVERAWSGQGHEDLASWNPIVSTPSMEGVLHIGHFGFDFTQAWRRVAEHLVGQTRERWCLLLAANAVDNGEPDAEQLCLLRAADPTTVPMWMVKSIYSAYADQDPVDFGGAGAVLAQMGERYASQAADGEVSVPEEFGFLSVDMHGSEEVVSMFEGALAWLQATPSATGQALLSAWSDCLIDNGGKSVLARIAALSLSRTDSVVARTSLAKAQLPDEESPAELDEILARYPDPATSRACPEDLSLLQAASLIALLRACPLDHVRWTLTPLRDAAAQRFEPTNKFIGVMFDLMAKGIIAVDASTPTGVIEARDGRLYAYLDRVVWRISAYTLELQRAIRDLPRQQWPEGWRSHAPVLARDLGVEELAVYLEHLLTDRSLPIPDMTEVREIFRVQLEQLAIAQCYYLAHKTMKETLDYQARYRPGLKQLQARVINLLRGNGEKAIAQGWDTRYERARDLPASLLFEALHDVLTGWGRRAFDEPVMTLLLADSK